ncbi:MAG: nucleotidyltransferase domain-containing protein [Nanoarchaeota archaeon]
MDIINNIAPSKKEITKVNSLISSFVKKLKQKIKDAKLELGGSMAKNTWLAGDHDIDFFIKFPYNKYKDKDISKILQSWLKGIKFTIVHGSRDYLQIRQGNYLFELIPVLDIKNSKQAVNITDVSPLHVAWVRANNKNPEQIRLTKAFLKANNLYGAESYISGFSGYITEALTIYYKTFMNLVKAAVKWQHPLVIDPSKYYKNKNEALRNLNKDKLASLVLIDPVQASRNAAAALSDEKFHKFIELCKAYLKEPHEEFFLEKKFNLNELKNKYKNYDLIVLNVKPLAGKEDIVGAKLLKAFNYIKTKLIEYGFKIKDANWYWQKEAYFYYMLNKEKLSKEIIHYGPPKDFKENVIKFKQKWKNYKIMQDNYKVYVKLKRKYTKANDYVKSLLKDKYSRNLVKGVKIKKI